MAPPKQAASAPQATQLTPPVQILVIVGLVAVVLFGYYMVFYGPKQQEIERERGRRAGLEQQLARARQDERRYTDDVAELNERRGRIGDLRRILPDNPDIPGFMRNINMLAEASGLQINLIQPAEEVVEQHFVRVPVRLEVTGSYLSLARFFHSVSQLPRVINMENIALENPTEENGEVKLHARVLATTFRARRPDENPPAGANNGNDANNTRPR